MKRGFLVILGVAACLMFFFSPVQAQQNLVFGMHPLKAPAELAKMFKPMIDYLEKETGIPVSFRSAKDYDEALTALVNGEIHISFMGPSLYVLAETKHPGSIKPLGTATKGGSPTFKGVIIVPEKSAINSLADLRGKKFAFGDRKSTMSCLVQAYMLMEAGVFDSIEYKFIGTHDNVAKAVSKGIFDAGAIKPEVAAKYVGKGVRIIAETEPIYRHVMAVSTKVDEETVKKIEAAVMKLKDPAVLNPIMAGMTGFVTTTTADYENLRTIMTAVDAKLPQ